MGQPQLPVCYESREDLQSINTDQLFLAIQALADVSIEGFDLVYDNFDSGRFDRIARLVIDPAEKMIVIL